MERLELTVVQLELTVVQLEEAKRFIQTDTVPHLRLALLLLDNAAEVLMHRAVQEELAYSDWHREWHAQMAAFLRRKPDDDGKTRHRLSQLAARIIPEKRKHKLGKYYNEKVDFLSQELHHMSVPVARVLKHIHDYRNEAYHNDRIRPDSIRPAVLILFDVVCTLLATLRQHAAMSWHAGDSEAWLERYGVSWFGYNADEIQAAISRALRLGLPLDTDDIRAALATHLTSRLDGIDDSIKFIAQNARPHRSGEEVLKAVQYWNTDRDGPPRGDGDPAFLQFRPQHTLASIERWRERITALGGIADKLELFNLFADIEDDFEPLERSLNEAAGLIDRAIQAEIDLLRGK